MNAFELNLYIFIAAIIVFGIYATFAARRVTSPKSFFYKEKLSSNIISLTAANITLGTGLAYLLQGSRQNGLLMLFIPIMVVLGYYLLAKYTSKYVASDDIKGNNFISNINEQITNKIGTSSLFGLIVSISLIIVYTIVLPFEIFASSKIITPLMFTDGGNIPVIIISGVIFLAALLYVLFGGIGAVFATDKLQLGAILLFLPTMAILIFSSTIKNDIQIPAFNVILKLDTIIIFNIIAASLAALSTQFYSLLNWGYISHVEASNRERLLKRVGLFAGILLAIVVAIGVFYPLKEGEDIVTNLMTTYAKIGSQSGIIIWLLSGISLLGMISIVFSTVDSLIIKIIMFYYDNILKRNSRSEESNPKEIRSIRLIVFLCFCIIFIFLGYFHFLQPNLFYLLLAIVGGVTAFAPMLATAGYLSYKGNSLKIFSNGVVYSYFGLFMLAGIVGITALLLKPTILGWFGTFTFIISCLFSLFLIIRAKQI